MSNSQALTIGLQANVEQRDILLLQEGDLLLRAWRKHLEGMVARAEASVKTRDAYLCALRQLFAWASERSAEFVSLDAEALLAWKAHLMTKIKPSSANLYIAGVRAFYAWATATGAMKQNHAAALKSVKRIGITKRHSRGWLSDEEAQRLLELELPAREHALIALMLYTGARGIELLRADLSDVRCEGSACLLYVQGKGRVAGEKEPLVLTPPAQQALHAWIAERGQQAGPLFISQANCSRGKRIAPSTLRWLIRSALNQAGITRQGISAHSLRHTAATNMLRNGGSIREAQLLLRHSSIETTMVYAHELDRMTAPPERWIDYSAKRGAQQEQEAAMR